MKKYLFLLTLAVLPAFAPLKLSAQSGVDNGHKYVDLGLPSGTKWADCNIGAKTRTNYGYYYAWGETSRKTKYDGDSYKFGSDKLTKYCTYSEYIEDGFTDDKEELDLSDDVARKLWGGKWRIPTKEQFEELIEYTKHRWTKINGVKGMLFTGRNGHSIFLPAAGGRDDTSLFDAGSIGRYWSRTLDADYPLYAYELSFDSDDVSVDSYYRDFGTYRGDGRTVRPVRSKN